MTCHCNKFNKPRCCVKDCLGKVTVERGSNGCYPCHCYDGHERCIQNGQLRGDRR